MDATLSINGIMLIITTVNYKIYRMKRTSKYDESTIIDFLEHELFCNDGFLPLFLFPLF